MILTCSGEDFPDRSQEARIIRLVRKYMVAVPYKEFRLNSGIQGRMESAKKYMARRIHLAWFLLSLSLSLSLSLNTHLS
jgi:hypothetical protein